MRRRTMGAPLAQQDMNRMSCGPASRVQSRMSMNPNSVKRTTTTRRRATMAPGAGSRRSTGGRKSLSSGRAKSADPRPDDATFSRECRAALYDYLESHGFEEELSPKLLSSPSQSLFVSIATFLLRQMDPEWELEDYKEDLPNIFQLLGYPVAIKKSWLVTVGAQHAWKYLLRALVWLVDLLLLDEKAAQDEPDDVYGDELTCDTFAQLEGENSEGVFFKYLEEAYDRWMKGDDDCASLEAKWARMFQQRNGEIQDEIDRLGADTEGMRKACSGLEAEVEHVAAQERLKANQASDVKKFRHLIDQFETLIGTIDSKTSQLSDEIATAERELQSKKDLRQQLQEKADQQRPRRAELTANKEELARLREDIDELQTVEAQESKLLELAEVAWAQVLDATSEQVDAFRELSLRLNIQPSKAFALGISTSAVQPKHMIKLNLTGITMPVLEKTFKQLCADEDTLKSQIREMEMNVDDTRDDIKDKGAAIDRLVGQYEQGDRNLEEVQNAFDAQERAHRERQDSDRKSIDQQRVAAKRSLEHALRALRAMQARVVRVRQRCGEEEAHLCGRIATIVEDLTNHRDYVMNALKSLDDEVRAMQAQVCASASPLVSAAAAAAESTAAITTKAVGEESTVDVSDSAHSGSVDAQTV